ncbi:MAG: hypothetical protein Q7T49_00270 [bacterium]|nr:hypothetical protein [bacterium]
MRTLIIGKNLYYLATNRRFLPWLLVFILILAASYIYLLHNAVYNLQVRQEALETVATLETDIAVLETRSITLLNTINLELAQSLGFTELKTEPTFARRNTAIQLSLAKFNEI